MLLPNNHDVSSQCHLIRKITMYVRSAFGFAFSLCFARHRQLPQPLPLSVSTTMASAASDSGCYVCGSPRHFQRDCPCCWQCGSPHHTRAECDEAQQGRVKLDTMLVAIENSFPAGHTSAGRRLIAEARDLVVDLMGPGP